MLLTRDSEALVPSVQPPSFTDLRVWQVDVDQSPSMTVHASVSATFDFSNRYPMSNNCRDFPDTGDVGRAELEGWVCFRLGPAFH